MVRKIALGLMALIGIVFIGFWITAPKPVNPAQYVAVANKYDVRIVHDA